MRAERPLRPTVRGAGVALATMGLIAASALGGCAKRPPASDPDALEAYRQNNDPLEPTNRFFYTVNTTVDRYTLKPVAQAYVYVVPQPARTGIHNVIVNLNEPITFLDSVLEAKPKRAGSTFMRFLLNSTAGVGGIFDVAGSLGYKEPDSNGGLTLAAWGVPSGPYLFVPVLGPRTARSLAGFGVDVGLSPYTYVPRGYGLLTLNWAIYGVGAIDARARVLHDLDELNKTALDPYATIRSAYQQHEASSLTRLRSETQTTPPDWYAR